MGDIRILAGFLTGSYGGVERYLIEHYRRLDHRRFSMDFLASVSEVPCEAELKQAGAVIYRVPSLKHPLACYQAIRKILQTRPYDGVHLNASTALWAGVAWAGKKERVPVLTHSHSSGFDADNPVLAWGFTQLHRMCKPLLSRHTDYFGACSPEAAAWMFPRRVVQSGRVHDLKNAIATDQFQFRADIRQKVRAELGLEPEAFVLGHVGNFMPVKNHRFLLDIFRAFLKREPKARLLLLGTGALESEIQEYGRALGLSEQVLFLGYQRESWRFYQAMDALVLPSLFEGFPLVAVEAQTAGLPCYLSDTITKRVALTDLVHFLALSSGPDEWAETIRRTGKGPRCGREREIAAAGYALDQEVRDLEQLYCQMKEEKEKINV